jgi:hypothetical protein
MAPKTAIPFSMKRTLFSALLLSGMVMFGACNNDKPATAASDAANPTVDNPNVATETEAPNPNAPVMTFDEKEFNFGDIQPGSVVKHTFNFTNTGKTPLLIENATASCGCTTPNWTKDPIAPGAKGTIDVQFDSHGKTGLQNKEVAVRANTQPNITPVTIKANVLPENSNGPVKQ